MTECPICYTRNFNENRCSLCNFNICNKCLETLIGSPCPQCRRSIIDNYTMFSYGLYIATGKGFFRRDLFTIIRKKLSKKQEKDIYIQAIHNDNRILLEFIKEFADRNDSDYITAAASAGNIDILRSLIKSGFKSDRYSADIALAFKHYECYEYLKRRLPYYRIMQCFFFLK
jgi:hypothetical protein